MSYGDWQAVALSFAILTKQRFDWHHYMGTLALKLGIQEEYQFFLTLNENTVQEFISETEILKKTLSDYLATITTWEGLVEAAKIVNETFDIRRLEVLNEIKFKEKS